MSTGSMETGPWRETGTMWQVRLRGWQPLCYVAILDIGDTVCECFPKDFYNNGVARRDVYNL